MAMASVQELLLGAPQFPEYRVPLSMHRGSREKLVARFAGTAGVVLLAGGKTRERYDTDTEILFRQESNFAYLFGVKEADFMGGLDLVRKRSFLLIPRLPPSYAVWLGEIHPPQHYQQLYEVDEAYYVDELPALLKTWAPATIFTTKVSNFDAVEKFSFENMKVDRERLQVELEECRLLKSAEEIALMRHVNAVSSWAHTQIMRLCRPGMGEHELEAAFQYLTYKNGRCRHQAYICICASGVNGATLHYPNNDKVVRDGQMLLMDMGGEYHCYCSDITCTYPANGRFTPDQRAIYSIVLRANQEVMKAMKPGVDWTDMHRLAERVICQGLLQMGVLRGEEKDLLAAHIPALFFPHGLGHLLGLDTHEPGGYPAGMNRIDEPGIRYLRTRRVLQAGMVITVEPGIYFNRVTLLPALDDPATARFFDAARVRGLLDFGGVRIEDDVVVTADGCENLTKVPRTCEEIEAVMAEGRSTLGARGEAGHAHTQHKEGCCKH